MAKRPPAEPAVDTVTVTIEELLAEVPPAESLLVEVDVAELGRELELVTVTLDELLAAVPSAEELAVLLESVDSGT